jgi:mRNA-degrading endonuclease RelE of RelBE toxin-antitoxin system
MLTVEFTERAIASFGKIEKGKAKRIVDKLTWLAEHPAPQTVLAVVKNTPPELAGVYRLRVGNYRVILWLEEDKIIVYDIGHRSKIYEILNRC